jgi:hypothetical protein
VRLQQEVLGMQGVQLLLQQQRQQQEEVQQVQQ